MYMDLEILLTYFAINSNRRCKLKQICTNLKQMPCVF